MGGALGEAEGLFEFEDGFEVAKVVAFVFMHEFGIDHREDDAAEIDSSVDAPVPEDRFGHDTVALYREVPQAFTELLAADVAGGVGVGLRLAVDLFHGVGQAMQRTNSNASSGCARTRQRPAPAFFAASGSSCDDLPSRIVRLAEYYMHY